MTKIGVVIQARMQSTRLPGKVLKPLPAYGGATILEHLITRVKRSQYSPQIIVAIPDLPSELDLESLALKQGVDVVRGDEHDVLSRYGLVVQKYPLEHVVRLTADCPFMDVTVLDAVIKHHLDQKADYTSNVHPRSFPHGFDVEVMTCQALLTAVQNASSTYDREHVTPYFYLTGSEQFTQANLEASQDYVAPELRLVVDTESDYAMACAVSDLLQLKGCDGYDGREIISLFKGFPWLSRLNGDVVQKKNYTSLSDELKDLLPYVTLQEMNRVREWLTRSCDIND